MLREPLCILDPVGIDWSKIRLRPGQKVLLDPGKVQFLNFGPFDWGLIEEAFAGWLQEA